MALTRVTSKVIQDGTISTADLSTASKSSISGSFNETSSSFSTRTTTLESASSSFAGDLVTIKGSGTTQGVGQSNSPTFAGGTITGDFSVGGTITAQEVHTEFESASILFTSGSTKFGDSGDDIHNMTGSIRVSGSAANESFILGHNLGIGNTAASTINSANNGGRLVVGNGSGNDGMTIYSGNGSGEYGVLYFADGTSGAATYQGWAAYYHDTNQLSLGTAGDHRVRITASGHVGIGTTSPQTVGGGKTLTVYGDAPEITLVDNASGTPYAWIATNDYGSLILSADRANEAGSTYMRMDVDGTERMRITSGGNVAIGTTSVLSDIVGYNPLKLGIEGTNYTGGLSVIEHQNGISGGILAVGKSRGTSAGAVTILQTDDITGRLAFVSADGVDFRVISAEIRTVVGASPGANDVPGHLLFMTNDGSGVDSKERMRIDSSGVLTTTSGSAVSTFTNQQKYYVSSPDATYLIANSPEEYTVTDSNANYKRMKTFIANRSGTIRVKWESYIQSGTYWYSWRFSKNNGSSTDVQYPALMTHPNGDNAQASYANGLASGVSNSVHAYREFDVALDGVEPGDQIELWLRSSDGSGGQVTGNGQTLYAKNFEVYSDVPNAPKHVAHQYGFTLEDGNALFGTRSVTTTNVGGASFAPNSVGRTILNLGSVNYTSEIDVVRLFNQNGEVGDIRTNGSGASFNSASDYRLKENEVTLSNALTRLNNLKPYRFNFKADSDTTLDGFFAHEVQQVVPEAVTGTKDQMMPIQYQPGDDIPEGKQVYDVKEYSTTEIDPQKLDNSKLVPLMVAAIQELSDENDSLKSRIEALES